MTTYYLIKGNSLLSEFDTDAGDVVALPLVDGSTMSLLDQSHVQTMKSNLELTNQEVLDAFGWQDHRGDNIKTVFVSRDITSLSTPVEGAIYKLFDIETNYALWEVDSNQDNVIAIHNELYTTLTPNNLFGIMGIVDVFGVSFQNRGGANLVGLSIPDALARRDLMVSYLNNRGYSNTTRLETATTEGEFIFGFVEALGYSEQDLWDAMVSY